MEDPKTSLTSIAKACLDGAEAGSMTFPDIVRTLMAAGFESYAIDFRRARALYYTAEGDWLELQIHQVDGPVAAVFDVPRIRDAIRQAQQLAPGYSYKGFCRTVVDAGCCGYVVSFLGRRAVYAGRTGETHVEHFPD
ncbi:DUF1398 domain-containing protein [Aquabacter cavernae]|uniref:DUF1398 domain-containing protein n=1 Tax=Aquabacter cavernae TaxID=2496029 RepID=UPI000F8D6F76|nr:DUF1398 domain-containing protein [Aquabacter cavernae]